MGRLSSRDAGRSGSGGYFDENRENSKGYHGREATVLGSRRERPRSDGRRSGFPLQGLCPATKRSLLTYAFLRNGVRALQVIVSAAVVILVTILTERREMPLAARLAVVSLAVAMVVVLKVDAPGRLADTR